MHDPTEILGRFAAAAGEARDALARSRVPRWELYAKASSWEESAIRPGRDDLVVRCHETGLAVRTVRSGRAGFAAGSGGEPAAWRAIAEAALATETPVCHDPLPPPNRLGTVPPPPSPQPPPSGWGLEFLHRLAAAVAAASRRRFQVTAASVRTGSTGWLLHTAEGFSATHRTAGALLVVEALSAEPGVPGFRRVIPLREPAATEPEALARRLVNPFRLYRTPAARRPGVTDLLLDATVAAHLIGGIVPLLLAPQPGPPPGSRIGSALLDLEDDRAGREGPVGAPCDGEGLPARTVRLVERGTLLIRLACHRDAARVTGPTAPGAVRPTFREPPRTGIANLLLRPAPGLSADALIEAAGRCLYLVDLAGPPEVDPGTDRYRLMGTAVTLEDGSVTAWHPLVEATGRLSRLLKRLEATGSSVTWHQTAAGVVGTPPLLFRGQLVV